MLEPIIKTGRILHCDNTSVIAAIRLTNDSDVDRAIAKNLRSLFTASKAKSQCGSRFRTFNSSTDIHL